MSTPTCNNNNNDSSVTIFQEPVPVISPEFCSPLPVDLVMVKSRQIFSHKFVVTDSNGNLMFKVNKVPLSFRSTHLIFDSAGKPLLTLKRKIISAYAKWEAFRGDSSDIKDLIFITKKSSLFQLHTNLDIFLTNSGNNESEEKFCDYKLKGGWISTSFFLYAARAGGGDSSNSILAAQMEKKVTIMGVLLGESKFEISVQQNVDYAFVVAVVTIFEDIITGRRRRSSNSRHS